MGFPDLKTKSQNLLLKQDSLMADVLTERERLETEYESLRDVREVYEQLEQKFQVQHSKQMRVKCN